MSKEYENQNVSYVIHGNYQLPCITTKELEYSTLEEAWLDFTVEAKEK